MKYIPNLSVLVVDGNLDNLEMFQDILRFRYNVLSARSGEEALEFLEVNTPGLILLDINLPDCSGYAVMERLQKDPRWQEIPVIFLAEHYDRADEAHGLMMGAVDYILGPIIANIVLRRIQIHLELQNYRKNLEQMVESKTNQLTRSQDTILNILANITAYRDDETGGHIRRTTMYAEKIVNHLFKLGIHQYRMNRTYADDIIKCAKLHDIGKVGIPDMILHKPGKLNQDEYSIIKNHTKIGAMMIDNAMRELGDDSSFLLVAREIVFMHHEWWNGKGYPLGLAGEDIPLSARIMTIADVYDALVSERPYKRSLSHEEAMEIIHEESGTHFDPTLVGIIDEIFMLFRDIFFRNNDESDSAKMENMLVM
ncbi:MAG: response regulator [Clostridiales bacterium]|nr:response regulator [Clostridiales bacterium]